MEKISVVIPVYKVEDYLEACVLSVCRQTHRELQIILVDDGSPDRCGEICHRLERQDDRIQVIHQPNGGLSLARNVGIDHAEGDYIAFIDSDDRWDPDMLRILLAKCKEHGAQIGECSYRSIYHDRVEAESACTGAVMELTPVEAMESNLDWGCCKTVAWNKLYRRDVIGQIRFPVGKLHEDEFTTHLFYLAAEKIVYVDAALIEYERRNAGSITASFVPGNLDACQALRERLHLIWSRPELRRLDEKACNVYCYILLERVALCEKRYPRHPALVRTIQEASEDFPRLKEHGLRRDYVMRLDVLFRRYRAMLPGREADHGK